MLFTMKLKKWQKVEVKWLDSTSDSGWKCEDVFRGERFLEHSTCGYFLNETNRAIKIIQSRALEADDDGIKVDHMMQIPKKAILKIRRLK